MLSNNIEDEEFMYAGLKLINERDFSKIDFYSITMLIFLIAAVSLSVVYFILNSSLNKLIEKEIKETEAYDEY